MTGSFPCPQCKATFGRIAHLRRHQKTHGIEKPYICQFCSVSSSRKDVIVRHTRNFHRAAMQSVGTPHGISEASSQEHPQSQSDLQFVEMEEVGLDYGTELDMFNFEAAQFRATDLGLMTSSCTEVTLIEDMISYNHAHISSPSLNPSAADTSNLSCKDTEYAIARANLANHNLNQTLSDFQFPSKHAIHRSVHAFFKHMAPHMPIVHKPTFRISSAASPLLIEIMACGALYLGEHTTAAKFHAAAQRTMFQVTQYESYSKDGQFQLWMLQTYLLMSYFGAYGGDVDVQERSANVFPYAIKLTQDALKELDASSALTYRDWVYRETISRWLQHIVEYDLHSLTVTRCIASAVEIGAGLASTDETFAMPFLDASFPLPSHTSAWDEGEIAWRGYSEQENSVQVLNMIYSGQKPTSSVSELGLVCLVSMLLWRVCSFKSLTKSHHLDQYADFVQKIESAVQVFDGMIQDQNTNELSNSLIYTSRFQLNTAVYHLYASKILAEMKRFVEHPDRSNLSGDNYTPKLHLALVRAAETLQSDCRQGICYIRTMAPHHFSPICAIACYEGGLLLTWYLLVKPDLSAGMTSTAKLDQLIKDALAEIEEVAELNHDQRSISLLAVVADLLSNRAVWQWPYSISKKLSNFVESSRDTPLPVTALTPPNDGPLDLHARRLAT